jgi:hypothetical protein
MIRSLDIIFAYINTEQCLAKWQRWWMNNDIVEVHLWRAQFVVMMVMMMMMITIMIIIVVVVVIINDDERTVSIN